MAAIIIVHPNKDEIEHILSALKDDTVFFYPDISSAHNKMQGKDFDLIILSTAHNHPDCLECLGNYTEWVRHKAIILNFGKDIQYLLQCFAAGALTFINYNSDVHELKNVIHLHAISNFSRPKEQQSFDKKDKIKTDPKVGTTLKKPSKKGPKKKIILENTDIYHSEKIEQVLSVFIGTLQSFFDEDTRIGIKNALYEILVNAMEHGNLGITQEEKVRRLNERTYDTRIGELIQSNTKKVTLVYANSKNGVEVTVSDQGSGFCPEQVMLKRETDGLCGRGIIIASYFFDEIEYNKKGNSVKLIKYFT